MSEMHQVIGQLGVLVVVFGALLAMKHMMVRPRRSRVVVRRDHSLPKRTRH
jgi:hypothetical protein